MRRREFVTLIGGAATWPLAVRAQQPAIPVIGFLSSLAHSDLELVLPGLHHGLSEVGFVEGRNIVIEYRWAEGDYQRLPMLAADLVNQKVAVIAAISGTPRCTGGQSGDLDDSDRVRDRRRPGRTWPRAQSKPSRRECDRCEFLHLTVGDQTFGFGARAGPRW
jgi:hypothetical protein